LASFKSGYSVFLVALFFPKKKQTGKAFSCKFCLVVSVFLKTPAKPGYPAIHLTSSFRFLGRKAFSDGLRIYKLYHQCCSCENSKRHLSIDIGVMSPLLTTTLIISLIAGFPFFKFIIRPDIFQAVNCFRAIARGCKLEKLNRSLLLVFPSFASNPLLWS
jgi:hypothetical protein